MCVFIPLEVIFADSAIYESISTCKQKVCCFLYFSFLYLLYLINVFSDRTVRSVVTCAALKQRIIGDRSSSKACLFDVLRLFDILPVMRARHIHHTATRAAIWP